MVGFSEFIRGTRVELCLGLCPTVMKDLTLNVRFFLWNRDYPLYILEGGKTGVYAPGSSVQNS